MAKELEAGKTVGIKKIAWELKEVPKMVFTDLTKFKDDLEILQQAR